MWNKMFCNRIIQEKIQSKVKIKAFQNDIRFHQRLANVKGGVTLEQPRRPAFLQSRPKSTLNKNMRNIEIDRQNQFLITKIRGMRPSRSSSVMRVRTESSQTSKNLSKYHKRVEEIKKKEINDENKKMIAKILSVSSGLSKLWAKKTDMGEQSHAMPKIYKHKVNIIEENKKICPSKKRERVHTEQPSRQESFIEEGLRAFEDKIQEEFLEQVSDKVLVDTLKESPAQFEIEDETLQE